MTHIEQLHLEAINNSKFEAPYSPIPQIAVRVAARKSAETTEQISCEFAEFISNHRLDFQPSTNGAFIGLDMKRYTPKELFQEYLKSKENDKTK